MSDPIRDIRTALINHDDPILWQAYGYIVNLEIAHARQRNNHKTEVERLTESRSAIARGLEREKELNADLEAKVERLREAHVEATAELLWYRAVSGALIKPPPDWRTVETKTVWFDRARAALAEEGGGA